MSDALRVAAARALETLDDVGPDGGAVERLTLDVVVDGKSEMVTLALRDGELVWTSTESEPGAHLHAALSWLAGVDGRGFDEPTSPGMRRTSDPDGARISLIPPAETKRGGEGVGGHAERVADALEDVVVHLTRAGSRAGDAPAIVESLERLRAEVPEPMPSGLARWVGRLREALESQDIAVVARLLHGATRLADDLRRERPSTASRRRIESWLGGVQKGTVERISDRQLFEVARELVPSGAHGTVEWRYLVDLQNGEVFREERSRGHGKASVGPCFRSVAVGLAEIQSEGSPRRIRLMQYTVSLELDAVALRRVAETAYRRFRAVAERYREALEERAGQAEPFVVLAPTRFGGAEVPVAYDLDGDPIGFARADDPAAVTTLAQLTADTVPRWVAGRLVDVNGSLVMVPCTVAIPDGDGTRACRIR